MPFQYRPRGANNCPSVNDIINILKNSSGTSKNKLMTIGITTKTSVTFGATRPISNGPIDIYGKKVVCKYDQKLSPKESVQSLRLFIIMEY